MSTATIDHEINFQDNQQSEADKRLFVQFFKDAVKNEFKSREAGRPVFEEFDFIRIITPGSRDTVVHRVADGSAMALRFPIQWARYKQNLDQNVVGTPLSQVPWLSVAQVAEFNAVGCKTVEQLVGMPDNLSQKFMGHHQIKQRAQAYLDAAKDAAPMLKLQAELEKRDEQIAALQAQMTELVQARKVEQAAKVPLKG
jgi:hypothetical protein